MRILLLVLWSMLIFPIQFQAIAAEALFNVINAYNRNWGLVTYREVALLVDPKSAPVSSKQRVAYVVAHERMCHFSFSFFYLRGIIK